MHNPYKNTRIEFHILQSFPVTCLNRDDVGAPKTAIVGGVNRARVSSQCWKRQVRLAMREFGIKLGTRTKHIEALIYQACLDAGTTEDKSRTCAVKISEYLSDDTLLFISDREIAAMVTYAGSLDFDSGKLKDKELAKVARQALTQGTDAMDIALFGRMVAKLADMNVEASASFAHAISTHKVSNEVEFFTALDDLQTEPGSAHMGTLEFNSATYYRYVSLDLGQLAEALSVDKANMKIAIEAFTRALFVAVPSARQTTQSGASPWEFASVLVRRGQRLQVPFETPVKAREGGYLLPSIEALQAYISKKEKLSGSMFGKLGHYDWGQNEDFSIDDLILALQHHVEA